MFRGLRGLEEVSYKMHRLDQNKRPQARVRQLNIMMCSASQGASPVPSPVCGFGYSNWFQYNDFSAPTTCYLAGIIIGKMVSDYFLITGFLVKKSVKSRPFGGIWRRPARLDYFRAM